MSAKQWFMFLIAFIVGFSLLLWILASMGLIHF